MNTGELITVIFLFAAAALLFFLSLRHFLERGYLLNNAYIYASGKERKTMDWKPYYRQSAIVFGILGVVFIVIALSLIFHNSRLLILEGVLMAGLVIYAVVSSVLIGRKKP